jgi:hypothetical protein
MQRRFLTIAVAVVVGLLGLVIARAAEKVSVQGCPTAGVEHNCLVIKGTDGATYDISGAKPRPRTGYLAISLTGEKSDRMGICMQGPILIKIKWTYTKQSCSK